LQRTHNSIINIVACKQEVYGLYHFWWSTGNLRLSLTKSNKCMSLLYSHFLSHSTYVRRLELPEFQATRLLRPSCSWAEWQSWSRQTSASVSCWEFSTVRTGSALPPTQCTHVSYYNFTTPVGLTTVSGFYLLCSHGPWWVPLYTNLSSVVQIRGTSHYTTISVKAARPQWETMTH